MSFVSPWALVGAAAALVPLTGLVVWRLARRAVERERSQAALLVADAHANSAQALELGERRLRELMDTIPVGVVFAGLDGVISSVNKSFGDLVGHGASDLVGKPVSAITHRDDRAEDRRMGTRLLAGELPSYTRIKRYDHSNGDIVFVRAHVRVLRGLDGEPVQLFGVVEAMPQPNAQEDGGAATHAQNSAATGKAPGGDPTIGGRVLYIEDNTVNVHVMRDLLEARPHIQMEVVGSAQGGIEAVRADRFDLVLLDWQLPDADGLQVLLAMAVMEGPRPPVVVISANAMIDQIEVALDAGAAHYITKPLDVSKLLDVLDRLLSKRD